MQAIRFLQIYYTHCHRGLGSGAGWQTKAKSKEIDALTQRVIEKHVGSYYIPRGNDSFDIDNQPVSFRSFSLGNDLWCISLTQYVGKGFQSSSGNFFAHSLVCSKSDFEKMECNPFHILRADCFVKEDPSEDRTELEPLEVTPQTRELSDVFDWMRAEFSGPDHQRLIDLLDAVVFSQSSRRPVILVLPDEKILNMMEGLICLLPLSMRPLVSFSTYDRSPYPLKESDPALANRLELVTCRRTYPRGKSDFNFTNTEYTHGYFIFNFIENRFSFEEEQFSGVPKRRRYSEWVCKKLFDQNYEEIELFYESMKTHKPDEQGIDLALDYYELQDAIKAGDDARVDRGIRFAVSKAIGRYETEKILENILKGIDTCIENGNSRYSNRLIVAALDAVTKGLSNDDLVELVYNKYLDLFRDSVERGQKDDAKELLDNVHKLPGELQIRLPLELKLTRGKAQYIVPLLEIAVGLLEQYNSYEDAIYDLCCQSLNDALEQSDGELSSALISVVDGLPQEKRIRVSAELTSDKGVMDYQIPLISKAIDHLSKPEIEPQPLLEDIYQRCVSILKASVSRKHSDEALELMKLLLKFPEAKYSDFYKKFFCESDTLDDLLKCLTIENESSRKFLDYWFPIALNVWVENNVAMPKIVYILEFMKNRNLSKYYGSLALSAVRKEIKQRRILDSSREFMYLICDLAAEEVYEKEDLYIQELLPLALRSGDQESIRVVIGNAAKEIEKKLQPQKINKEIERFLDSKDSKTSALEIIVDMYPDDAPDTLYSWYKRIADKRLSEKRTPGEKNEYKIEMLSDLYKMKRYELLLRDFEDYLQEKKGHSLNEKRKFIVLFIKQLLPIQMDFVINWFPRFLNAIAERLDSRLPDIELMQNLSHDAGEKIAPLLAAVGQYYVKTMNISSLSRHSQDERAYIKKCLESDPQHPKDNSLLVKLRIAGELLKLKNAMGTLQKSLKELLDDLPIFMQRKDELEESDFKDAADSIYTIFASVIFTDEPWGKESFGFIEEISRWRKDDKPSADLIQTFLGRCREKFKAADYLMLLKRVTVRWMRSNRGMQLFDKLLPEEYSELSKDDKKDYEQWVENYVKASVEDNREQKYTSGVQKSKKSKKGKKSESQDPEKSLETKFPGFNRWEEMTGRKEGLSKFQKVANWFRKTH